MTAELSTTLKRKPAGKVTILGINGHIGNYAARAFAEAGWAVTGFGRSNRLPLAGVTFRKGDAANLADLRAAIADADVVVNALNLPYHQWDKGRMEAQTALVIEALKGSGKTQLYPGNIYNYAASQRHVSPDAPQNPQTPRGAIRVRCEALLREAAERGDFRLIVLRAGDFYAPRSENDWFQLLMLREARKGRVAMMGAAGIGHSWAYLPDLGRAFEKLAWHRADLGPVENFHFAGHFVTHGEMVAAIEEAAPVKLARAEVSWRLLRAIGLVAPTLREVAKMGYLWSNTMQLQDARLDAILGPDFGTPFKEAIATVVAPFFADEKKAA